MSSEQNKKVRKPRRTKGDLDNAINKAAERLIMERGFSNTLITDIMKILFKSVDTSVCTSTTLDIDLSVIDFT